MADHKWGHCRTCKHFGSPAAQPLSSEEASCKQPTLVQFALRIYGSNGCNGWELRAGLAPDAEMPRMQQAGQQAPMSGPGMGI